jgi:hypothetical protein
MSSSASSSEELFEMMPQAPKYFSESQRRTFDRGVAHGFAQGFAESIAEWVADRVAQGILEGTARGQSNALLRILARRGLQVTDEQRCRIEECTDLLTLDGWLEAAFVVTSVEELFT